MYFTNNKGKRLFLDFRRTPSADKEGYVLTPVPASRERGIYTPVVAFMFCLGYVDVGLVLLLFFI